MPINPLPNTNKTDKNRKILFEIHALAKALLRIDSKASDSIFSLEKTIRLNPEINSSIISSSAKFVRKNANILVSINDENTANTGIVNLKSNQKYSTKNTIPVRISIKPINLK